MAPVLPRLYTSTEAAAYLGISERTLARLRSANKIGFVTVAARRYRYTEDQLRSFLHDRAGGALIREELDDPGRQRRAIARQRGSSPPPSYAALIFGTPRPRSKGKPSA